LGLDEDVMSWRRNSRRLRKTWETWRRDQRTQNSPTCIVCTNRRQLAIVTSVS